MTKKTYQEVVRGIRTSKEPTMYISEILTEIRQEIKGTDRNDKVVSLLKLLYLNLLGYSFEWAEFHVIEVMSQPNYRDRRVGYLAATVLIRPDSELFILCANSLKKAFLSKNKYDVGLALDCFSMIVTEELAHDLLPDILNLLKSKRAFVRRKAVLCLYRIFNQYPGALDESYEQLVKLLIDPDITVQNSAVSVITELAREDPARYQNVAPTIYGLLTSVENKWILIKLIKLLNNLMTEEPRLAKKALDPLVNIVRSEETKSLLYEAMVGVCQCLTYMTVKPGSKLAKEVNKVSDLLLSKSMEFVQDDDPNLKYLGLCCLYKLVEVTPLTVAKKSYVYVDCMKANDSTIRMKALELIQAIANPKNLKNLVEDLVNCLHSGVNFEMKEDIIAGIIDMCSRDTYANMQDFAWYVTVLVDLASTKGSHQGELISNQLIEVALRVPSYRLFIVNAVLPLLLKTDLICESMYPVLIGAAWVVGEYSGYLQQDQIANVFASLVAPSVSYLPTAIQATILQALLQVSLRFICAVGSATEQAVLIKKSVIQHTEQFLSSESDEVRYRASLLIEVLSVTSVFDNEVVEIKKQDNIQKEIESVNSARKEMTSQNEKTEDTTDITSLEINIGSTLEAEEDETPKEDTPVEDTPADDTPRDEIEEGERDDITHLSALLERLTEELLPVSSKAQRKVKIPEGLDLDTPITSLVLDKEIEPASSVSFNDGPLFTYVSKEESHHRHHRHGKKSHKHREEKNQFYLDKDEDEGEVRELTFEEVGVKVVEGPEEEEQPAPKIAIIRNADDSSEEEKPKKHRSHRSHRTEEKVEEVKEVKEEKKHRHHRHH